MQSIPSPFQQGQDLAGRLILLGVLAGWPITDQDEAHEIAMRYACYMAPCAALKRCAPLPLASSFAAKLLL